MKGTTIRKSIMYAILLLTVCRAFSQTISIPVDQAKEITKGLINEKKLKEENKLLSLDLKNCNLIKVQKDTLITNLRLQLTLSKQQIDLMNRQLELRNEQLKFNQKRKNNGWFWGAGGTALGMMVGVVLTN